MIKRADTALARSWLRNAMSAQNRGATRPGIVHLGQTWLIV